MHEFSLITLSTLLQSAVGLSVMLFAYRNYLLVDASRNTITYTMFAIAATASIGLLIGATHMGYPMNAPYSITNVKTSWLSREVLLAPAFIGSIGLLFIMAILKKSFNNRLLGIACVFGVFDVFALASIYQNSSIITWNETYTMALHMGGIVLLGALCVMAFMAANRKLTGKVIQSLLMLTLAVIFIRAVSFVDLISGLEASAQEQGVMFPWDSVAAFKRFESLLVAGWSLGIASAISIVFYLYKNKGEYNTGSKPLLIAIAVMVILYEMLCRIHFYQFYI